MTDRAGAEGADLPQHRRSPEFCDRSCHYHFLAACDRSENFFCKLKEFKRIAMRSDKTDASFSAMIYLSAAVINSR